MTFDFQDNKSKRKAKYIWENILLKPKNYFNHPDEILKHEVLELMAYELKINPRVCIYPKRNAQQEIRNLTNIICQIPEFERSISFGTVYKSVRNELQCEISLVLASKPTRAFESVLKSLFSKLRSSIEQYDFYFSLEGIELLDISSIDFGSIQILKINVEERDKILCKAKEKDHRDLYMDFINKNFLEKVCIQCHCSGNFEVSKRNAKIKAREFINYFRFMVCLLFYQRIPENLLKITITSETYIDDNQILANNVTSGDLVLQWDSTRSPSENFHIDQTRLEEIHEKLYVDTIFSLLNSDTKTELEGVVLAAMYWTGEAQNEFDWDIAFLKYWTALECIFSHRKEEVTSSLSRGISILATFSGYRFVEKNKIDEVYKLIKGLYDKRSQIVHRGLRNSINEEELIEVCKYASWTVLSLLHLISTGYETISQLEEQILKWEEAH